MKIPLIIFFRALGFYLLFTIPALAVPFVYFYSAFLAVVFGTAAGFLFLPGYWLVTRCSISVHAKLLLLVLLVPVGITASYALLVWWNAAAGAWGFNAFLIFPAIAVIAGWASLFASRNALSIVLHREANEFHSFSNQ